jgi:hypothetical protein
VSRLLKLFEWDEPADARVVLGDQALKKKEVDVASERLKERKEIAIDRQGVC